jgi:hypothetical protein
VNTQTEKLFGHARLELLNQPIETLIPERFRGKHVGHRAGFMSNAQLRPMGAGLELHGLRKMAPNSRSKSVSAPCKRLVACLLVLGLATVYAVVKTSGGHVTV